MKAIKLLDNWEFTKDDVTETITIPHDFMIGTERTKDSSTGDDYGYFQPCKGSYKKNIVKDTNYAKYMILFDGVMGLTEVFINNNKVAFHPYGYTAFYVDLSEYLVDGDNELVVKVDAMNQPASRWYTGAGIYREVKLLLSNDDYIMPFGISAKTISIEGNTAYMELSSSIYASRATKADITYSIDELDVSITRHVWLDEGENIFSYKTLFKNIETWDLENPKLYELKVSLAEDEIIDSATISFGIRTVICSDEGLLLNGKVVKLYGTCNHHDNGIVGAASYRTAEERRVRIMKESGFNAIRTSHNPPSSMLLDVCDRLGMLVIDEIVDMWNVEKRPYDYHLWFEKYIKEDIKSWILRDQNHPSVIMWSTGNEIFERSGFSNGYHVGKMICEEIKKYDTTRPLTHAFCCFWESPELYDKVTASENTPYGQADFWCEKINPQTGNLDVLGYNYFISRVDRDSKYYTEHLFVITESYPVDAVIAKKLMDIEPKMIGEFVWTGWDYFGETGVGHFKYDIEGDVSWGKTTHPEHIANCGDFDICGFKKPQSYLRDAAWFGGSVHVLTQHPKNFGRKVVLSQWGFYDISRTWTYNDYEGKDTAIYAFTTAYECEVMINGRSLGKKQPNENGIAIFNDIYEPGELVAISYDEQDNELARDLIKTTNKASKIVVNPTTKTLTGEADIYYAEISLVDDNDLLDFDADNQITVTTTGGKVLGTGSGRIDDTHIYTSNTCNAYHGRLLVAIKPEAEKVVLNINVEKLGEVTIEL